MLRSFAGSNASWNRPAATIRPSGLILCPSASSGHPSQPVEVVPISLRVLIEDDEGRTALNVLTCPLDIPEPMQIKFCVAWSLPDEDWSVYLNGVHVGSSDASDIPERVCPEKLQPRVMAGDYKKQNETAVQRRHDRLAGWQPIPRRVQRSLSDIRGALEDELSQIDDLLDHLRNEKLYHAKGLSSRLRMLIATGNPLPLLQLYAANTGRPLTIYVDEPLDAGVDLPSEATASFAAATIQARPVAEYTTPVDLDVWLDSPWGTLIGETFTHRRAIKSIADTVGSHFDQDARPLTVALRSTESELHGLNADFMLLYIGHLATIVAELGRSVLRDDVLRDD